MSTMLGSTTVRLLKTISAQAFLATSMIKEIAATTPKNTNVGRGPSSPAVSGAPPGSSAACPAGGPLPAAGSPSCAAAGRPASASGGGSAGAAVGSGEAEGWLGSLMSRLPKACARSRECLLGPPYRQGTRAGSRERERAPAVRQTDAVLGAVPRKAAATLAPIPNICLAISMPSPPWSQPHGVDAIVEQWLASGSVRRCLAAERLIGSRDAEHAPIP